MKGILFLCMLLPIASYSADITGLGDIKIGSSKAEIKQLMKVKKAPILARGMDFGTYEGGSFDAFEKVFITPRIQLQSILLYYHDDYLHSIEVEDDFDDADLKELLAGFRYKYGEPSIEITRSLEKNPCDESQELEEVTKKEIFNKGAKIEATYVQSFYVIPGTNKPVPVCDQYLSVGFSVYDKEVLNKAIEKQNAQNKFDEQNEINERFEGL